MTVCVGFYTEGGGPGIPPQCRLPQKLEENLSYSKVENLFSLILLHDTVAVPHKLLPLPTENPV